MPDQSPPPTLLPFTSFRGGLVFLAPFASLLLLLPLIAEGPPDVWNTLPSLVRAGLAWGLLVAGLALFLIVSDLWYRFADPSGLGAKRPDRADLVAQLGFGGTAAMVLVGLLHGKELSLAGYAVMLVAALVWPAALRRLPVAAPAAARGATAEIDGQVAPRMMAEAVSNQRRV